MSTPGSKPGEHTSLFFLSIYYTYMLGTVQGTDTWRFKKQIMRNNAVHTGLDYKQWGAT